MSAGMFHLGWFLDGYRVPAWPQRWSGDSSRRWTDGSFFVEMAGELERACFDLLMIEDSNYVPDVYRQSMDVYLKYGQRAPKLDPAILAALIGAQTRHLGIVATIATSEISPFRLARLMGTLDHTTGGRIGWNVVTGSNDRAAQNFGHAAQLPHDERYERADEFVDVVKKLWNSWDDGAVVRDETTGVYADAGKVHAIDHEGPYFRVRGPLNMEPGPQRVPTLLQAGVSPRGQRFAARNADAIITPSGSIERMKEIRDNVRRQAAENGRSADDVKLLFLSEPVLGETDEEARAKARRLREERDLDLDYGLSSISSVTGIDMARFDPDEPLPEDIESNAHSGTLRAMAESRLPLRELVTGPSSAGDTGFVGTPATVADRMEELIDAIGGDGFLLSTFAPTRRYVAEVVDGLVPELQRRGRVRSEYTAGTLRGNLREF